MKKRRFYALKWCIKFHLILMKTIKPTYTVIKLRHLNRTIPTILFLNESEPRISESTLKFSQMLMDQKKSDSLIAQFVNVIANLIEYKTLSYNPQKGHPRLFLDQYIKDLSNGHTPLKKPLKKKTLQYVVRVIKEYSRWLTKHQDILKDPKEVEWAKFVSQSYKFLESNHMSKMFEPKHTKGHLAGPGQMTILKSFPIHKLFDLLRVAPARDKLLISMMAFSGRRPAELLHLFSQDIKITNDQLNMKVFHPSLSKIGKQTRREYLKDNFNLTPRNEISGYKSAGFRGIKFENQLELSSEAYFIFNMERYLVPVHNEYLSIKDSLDINHPYYFINLKDGSPLTLKSLETDFYNLCEEVGLSREVGSGVSLISLRHFYGAYLSQVLSLDPIEVKRLLSQINPQASLNYYNNKETVWSELKRINL